MNYKVKIMAVGLQGSLVRVVEADSIMTAMLIGARLVQSLNEEYDYRRHVLIGVFESTGLVDRDGKEVFDNDTLFDVNSGLESLIHKNDEGEFQISSSNLSMLELLSSELYEVSKTQGEVSI